MVIAIAKVKENRPAWEMHKIVISIINISAMKCRMWTTDLGYQKLY
jgi:hypothetical protein